MAENEPDWKAIAMEIWNDFDNIALFIESHLEDQQAAIKQYPFLEKNLPTRFKYFRFYRGRIMTIPEYEKALEEQKMLTERLFRNM